MILSTVPDMIVLGGSGIRAVSSFRSAILADLAMRGFAISLATLARVTWWGSFLLFLCGTHRLWHQGTSDAVPFGTGSGPYFRFCPISDTFGVQTSATF